MHTFIKIGINESLSSMVDNNQFPCSLTKENKLQMREYARV